MACAEQKHRGRPLVKKKTDRKKGKPKGSIDLGCSGKGAERPNWKEEVRSTPSDEGKNRKKFERDGRFLRKEAGPVPHGEHLWRKAPKFGQAANGGKL